MKISKPITKASFDYFNKINDNYTYDLEMTELKPKLKKLGWRRTDAGAYGSVYVNSSKPYVLKISKRPDEAYEKFVRLIKKYPNKHFPKNK